MEELLHHPAVQSGVVPFAVALLTATALRKTRQLGLSIAIAFLCAVALTMGLDFESLTSVRKLVLAATAAAALGAVLEFLAVRPQWTHRVAIALATCLTVLWVLQRLLMQGDAAASVLAAAGASLFCLALLVGGERASQDPVCAAAIALVLGLASGALAVLGASAQLAQLGIAMGAGAGAVLLVQMLANLSAPVGWTLGLSAQVIAGLVGTLAVMTGSLPWYCLLPLLLVAWAARMAPTGDRPVWQRAVLCASFGFVPALIAVALAWFTGGQSAV